MLNTIGLILIMNTIMGGILKVWQKKVSRYFEADTFTILIQVVSVLCILPMFLIFDFKFDFTIKNILLVIVAGASWYIGSLITNRSIKKTDLTLREPIIQTRTIFVLFISFIFLQENISLIGLSGALLVFLGAMISSYKTGVSYASLKKDGVWITVLASFLIAVSYSFDKYALNFIDVLSWGFFMYLIPVFFLIPKFKPALQDIKKQSTRNMLEMLVVVLLNSVVYLLLIFVISKTSLSWSYPISQLGSIVVFIGGLFLGEKTNIRNRAIGSAVGILGGLILFFK